MKKCSDEFPKYVFDPSAETAAEMMVQWPGSRDGLNKFIRRKIDAGEWEVVHKRIGNHIRAAYRCKKR